YEKIDYGGLETEDAHAAVNYMLDTYSYLDAKRVGAVGWSHGGLIVLHLVFAHPSDYAACFAGVPVSDLVARMGYSNEEYRALFSAPYHIGKTAEEDVAEYKKRSPAWNASKLKTPLLIHTNTNDEDVNALEVEHLIQALKAEGKPFEYEVFQKLPGGHSFDRMDTRTAKEIRLKIYQFLAKHLAPPVPLKTLRELEKAGYPR
ncbi:MAG TPA: prolyl oligopeptidase family serine peptidase, partial [bacterium]